MGYDCVAQKQDQRCSNVNTAMNFRGAKNEWKLSTS
jgi:hypothetical protein